MTQKQPEKCEGCDGWDGGEGCVRQVTCIKGVEFPAGARRGIIVQKPGGFR